MGCVATKGVKIVETPVKISKVNVLGTDDCVVGNTQLVVETEGNRLPLVYGLNGKVVNGPVINLPRTAGQYQIEVSDSLGCVAKEEKYYPAYDSLIITYSSISACDLVDGSIQLSYEGTDASKLNFSIDGGISWYPASTTFNQLAKGVYLPKVKQLDSDCEINGDSIFIAAPDCFPLAAFTKDTLFIRDPQKEVVLPWRIERNGYSDTAGYTLRIGREGDGVPHFTGSNLRNLKDQRLRSTNPIHFRDYAPGFAGGIDSLTLTLQDSASQYRSPAAYVFQLETTPESPLRVDPLHGRLIVYVNFTDSVIIERKEVVICPGTEQITLGEDLGEDYCYAWEGPVSSNLPLLTISPTQNGEYKLNIIRKKDFKVYKTIIYSVKVESKQVQITSSGNLMCEGGAKLLGLQFSDGVAIDPLSWVIGWEDGSSAVPRAVRPQFSTTYRVILVNQISGCTIEDTLRMEVLEKPKYVKILPEVASICGQLPGVELELEAWPLRTDVLNYFWSNGVNDYKTKVTKPGTYYVEVAHKSLRSCATRFYHQVEEGIKVTISVDSSQVLCPESLPLSAKVLNPISGMNYTFNWSTGARTQSIVLEPGVENYTVTVSTSGGACSGSQSLDVSPYLNKLLSDQQGKFSQKMTALGFSSVACKIVPIAVSPKPDLRSQEGVEDYAGNVTIEIEGARFNLNQRLTRVVSSYRSRGLYAKGLITPGCPEDVFDEKFTQYRADQEYNDIILRVVKNADPGGDDQLFVFVESDSMSTDNFLMALKDEALEPSILVPIKEFLIVTKSTLPSVPAYYCAQGGQTDNNPTLGQAIISNILSTTYREYTFEENCQFNNGQLLSNNFSFNGEMFIRETTPSPGTAEYFLAGSPKTNHTFIWLLNNQDLQVSDPYDKITYAQIEDLLNEGPNTLSLRVIHNQTNRQLAEVSIQIQGFRRYSIDLYRVVADRAGNLEYFSNKEYMGDPEKKQPLVEVGTNIRFTLQLKENGNWVDVQNPTWTYYETSSSITTQLNYSTRTGFEFPDIISVYHPRMKTTNFTTGIYQKELLRESNFKTPTIDPLLKNLNKIQNDYNQALKGLQKKHPILYNLLSYSNIDVRIVGENDPTFNRSKTLAGHTDNGTGLFMQDLDIDNEVFNSNVFPPNKVIQDGRLIARISQIDYMKISGAVLNGVITTDIQGIIAKVKVGNPRMADSIQSSITLSDMTLLPKHKNIIFEVNNNNWKDYLKIGVQQTIIYINWDLAKAQTDVALSLRNTLAHELVHASFPAEHPLVSLKWSVIRARSASRKSVDWILADEGGKNGPPPNCSEGVGHEWFNPENAASCGIEK